MEVILLDHIEKVGAKHEVVKVKDGYGRNYLIPQGLAMVANKPNMARLEGLKKQAGKKEAVLIASYQEVAGRLKGQVLRIEAKAGESGRLFGSVSAQHVVQALKDLGVEADKRMIEMPEEVKELGTYEAIVRFHPQVEAPVNFEVVAEG
jgi:large subunit ribosomal protein L9